MPSLLHHIFRGAQSHDTAAQELLGWLVNAPSARLEDGLSKAEQHQAFKVN